MISSRVREDHPRIRGEHPESKSLGGFFHGSSPHTRGARTNPLARFKRGRIIPAYAGSTPPVGDGPRPGWDHPRIRGEHDGPEIIVVEGLGSSPHTRGAPAPPVVGVAEGGIIPAYAGSTTKTFSPPRAARDHPRIRGEHFIAVHTSDDAVGSSPHTRGALGPSDLAASKSGIIPAYAGSTRRRPGLRLGPADHPRIRGEHAALPQTPLPH